MENEHCEFLMPETNESLRTGKGNSLKKEQIVLSVHFTWDIKYCRFNFILVKYFEEQKNMYVLNLQTFFGKTVIKRYWIFNRILPNFYIFSDILGLFPEKKRKKVTSLDVNR